MVTRFALCLCLVAGLLAAQSPAVAAAATTHKKAAANKLRVHVVSATGKSVGHARLSIRRVGYGKPNMSKTTNGRGTYTTASLPVGNYTVRAKHGGYRAATSMLDVAGSGTHRMTVRLGKTTHVVAAAVVHPRTAHALGTKAVVKKATPPTRTIEKARPAPAKAATKRQAV